MPLERIRGLSQMTDVIATERYQKALRQWVWKNALAESTRVDPESINNIHFTEDGGYSYSEYTQADDYAVIAFDYQEHRVVGSGKKKGETVFSKQSGYHTISYLDVGTFIGEVCDLME